MNLRKMLSAPIALLLALGGVALTAAPAGATGQETCPDGGGWTKIEPIDALTYTYTAPEGQLVAEVCYKASTTVIQTDIEDAASYEFISTVKNDNDELQEISHVSVKLTEPVDVCDNLEGVQTSVPDGLVQEGDDCVEPEPEPQECVVVTAWGTEADDTPPTLTPDGYLFEGGSGNAVGYGLGITGNLQGLPTINYVASGDLDVFYPRIVINSLADGGWAYDSLTVISEGPVDGSSIAASNKRGFIQHTLDEWADLLPNNTLVAFFFHLDSGAGADKAVTLESVSGGCFSANFAPVVPEPVTGEDVEEEVNCESGEVDITTTPWSQDQVWDAESKSYQPGPKVYGEPVPSTRELTEDEYIECYGEQPEPESGSDKSQECDGSILVETTVDWTQEWKAEKTGYVLQEKVYSEPKVARIADDPACFFPPALALTGNATSATMLTGAGGTLALGVIVLTVGAILRRRKALVE